MQSQTRTFGDTGTTSTMNSTLNSTLNSSRAKQEASKSAGFPNGSISTSPAATKEEKNPKWPKALQGSPPGIGPQTPHISHVCAPKPTEWTKG
eukprot:g13102.t1